jgi:Mrp family chromosome partitioning ATPase
LLTERCKRTPEKIKAMATLNQALQSLQQPGRFQHSGVPPHAVPTEENPKAASPDRVPPSTPTLAAMQTSVNVSMSNTTEAGWLPQVGFSPEGAAIRPEKTMAMLEAAVRDSLDDAIKQFKEPNRPTVTFQEMLHRISDDGAIQGPASTPDHPSKPGWSVDEIIARAVELENASCLAPPPPILRDGQDEERDATSEELENALQFAALLARENSGLMVDLTPPVANTEEEFDALAIELDDEVNPPEWLVQNQERQGDPSQQSPGGTEDTFAESLVDTLLGDNQVSPRVPREISSNEGKERSSPFHDSLSSDSLGSDSLDDIEKLMQEFASEFSSDESQVAGKDPADPVEIAWATQDLPTNSLPLQPPVIHPLQGAEGRVSQARKTSVRSVSSIHALPEAIVRARREPLLWQAFRGLGDQVDHDLPSRGTGSLMLFGAHKEAHVTDTALQLAYYQAEEGMRRVVVVDGNFSQKSLSMRLGIENQPGLTELSAQLTEWDRVVSASPHERLFALGAGQRTHIGEIQEVAFLSVIMELSNNFDLVIVDAGEVHAAAFPAMYNACDCSYLIARLGRTPRDTMQKVVAQLRAANRIPTGCIVTNAPAGHDMALKGHSIPPRNRREII